MSPELWQVYHALRLALVDFPEVRILAREQPNGEFSVSLEGPRSRVSVGGWLSADGSAVERLRADDLRVRFTRMRDASTEVERTRAFLAPVLPSERAPVDCTRDERLRTIRPQRSGERAPFGGVL